MKINSILNKDYKVFLFFLVVTFIVFLNSLNGAPIWDDIYRFFGKSQWFGSGTSISFFWENGFRWPIFQSVLYVLFKLFAKNPTPYHVISFFLHGLNCFLFFKLLSRFNFKWPILTALLYLVYPLNVQNVSWIIQLKSLLALSFCFGVVFQYLKFSETGKIKNLIISSILLILMLMTKSFMLHLPTFFFIYEFYKSNKLIASLKKIILPTLISLAYALFFFGGKHVTYFIKRTEEQKTKELIHSVGAKNKMGSSIDEKEQARRDKEEYSEKKDIYERIIKIRKIEDIDKLKISEVRRKQLKKFYTWYYLNQKVKPKVNMTAFYKKIAHMSQIFNYYFVKVLFPFNLQGFYSTFKINHSLRVKTNIVLFIFALIFFYILFIRFLLHKASVNSILLICAFMSYLPVSGIIRAPFMSITDVSDHHMLIALLFLSPIIISIPANIKKVGGWVSSFIILVFGIQSFVYADTFRNSENFYRNIIEKDPDHLVAYLNLGHYLKLAKRYNESRKVFYDGNNKYRELYPELVAGAKIPRELLTASYTSKIYHNHPYLDPYFLLIVRHLASFKAYTKEEYEKLKNNQQNAQEDLKNN